MNHTRIKVAFVQQFGFSENGGGSRILRTLTENAPFDAVSICTQLNRPRVNADASVPQHWVPLRPMCFLDHTRFSSITRVFEVPFAVILQSRIYRKLNKIQPDAVHVIPHSEYDWQAAFAYSLKYDIPLLLSVHDDLRYTLGPRYRRVEPILRQVWQAAACVFCISDAMGREYCRRFGDRSFGILTDGADVKETRRLVATPNRLYVYFCGLLHYCYLPNFLALLKFLTGIRREYGLEAKLILRGSTPFKELEPFADVIELWPFDENISSDFDKVDLLYLPLPFASEYEDFVRYSLSTKLVSYLASGLPIFYHGPPDSALGNLLDSSRAATMNTTVEITRTPSDVNSGETQVGVANALNLAREQFSLQAIRCRFNNALQSAVTRA